MKIMKFAGSILLSVGLILLIIICDINDCTSGSTILSVFLGLSLPWIVLSFQNLLDTTDWKVSQRRLKRGGFINDNTIVRISFAYLFRIKVGSKYLLVKNERGTEKFQPVGGVYKFKDEEKSVLTNQFHVMDDNKISIDASSRDDYRLRMENRYLRKFIKRFNKTKNRESIENLGREFTEELVNTGILNWNKLTYRYCGRHITELKFEEHFQIYELLLADVVELIPTEEQTIDLNHLFIQNTDERVHFATAEEINALGIDTTKNKLNETIGDHTKKILQEMEPSLTKVSGSGELFTVNLSPTH